MPQNTVRSIVQTRDGYLWLTTFAGWEIYGWETRTQML
ncbi:MAG: two-component regulator propeller domain-containing protein [Blastocatellales bacterium]